MKVENVHIERKESYDANYPNQLVGLVQIIGEHGKMEVKLTNAVVGQIFALIKSDVQKVADYNASQASAAIEEAENEMPLIDEEISKKQKAISDTPL